MAGWFVLSSNDKGQYSFMLKAANGETILQSEAYESRAAAEAGIASVQQNSPIEERYQRKTASNGKPFFNLLAANHRIIGTSELYQSEASRESGIASVKANGSTPEIKEI